MNYKEIEKLKTTLLQVVRQGCRVKNEFLGLEGRLVGIGFKPFWTNPEDTKIDRIELNIMDTDGRINPFHLNYVIGCNFTAQDGKRLETSKKLSLDIHLFSPKKVRDSEPYDKVSIQIEME